jgi:hypothetical protein
MAIYRMADRTSNVTTAAACFEIRSASTNNPRILEIKITLVTAAATVIGVGKPAAIGVTPTSPKTVIPENQLVTATGLTTTAVAWATGPTVPANYLDRISFPATIGAGIVLTYDDLRLATSNSIILWNILGGATLDVGVKVDE